MKILWVEDKNDILTSGIFENKYFHSYLTTRERRGLGQLKSGNFKKVKKFLQKTNSKVFLASNLKDAIKIIEENDAFDKIILDINFPIENCDLYKYLEEDFFGEEKKYQNFLNNIKDEFAGIILNHIIVKKYKDEFDWDKKNILSDIVFLSGNGIKFNNFDKRINSMYGKSFKYDTDASEVQFFDKKKDEKNFLKWLIEDEYTIILDRYVNQNAVNNFLELSKNKDNPNPTIIKGNLVNLRQLLENHIAKKIVEKVEENPHCIPTWNPQIRGNHGVNFGGFISLLNQASYVLDKSRGEPRGYLIMTEEEISDFVENINDKFSFNKREGKTYKLRTSMLVAFLEQKNEHSFNSMIKALKDMDELTFGHRPRLNEDLFVSQKIYNYIKSSWNILSELIHNEGNLTPNGDKFIEKSEKAINTINILYYQIKEIILWFNLVMERV